MSDGQDTVRAHLESIRDERDRVHSGESFAAYVASMARVTEHAVAALAILDNAKTFAMPGRLTRGRLVPDPDDGGAA